MSIIEVQVVSKESTKTLQSCRAIKSKKYETGYAKYKVTTKNYIMNKYKTCPTCNI
jgi:predicted  nucleic acid-binding Zn ribbon protein